ncbi:MAG TPA: amino acid ABC transporter substrate-binding protein [Usitatibacter sp.]|nr:amino acid ABC transporter substrate-binding protein [Usitatibacter sp.]
MKFSTAIVLAFAGFAAVSQAGTLDDIKKRGTIRLGYSETSVPFSFKSKAGEPAGYSVELCKRVAAGVARAAAIDNLKTEWVALTPSDRIDAVASGKVDLECGTTTTSLSRREKVDFSLPIFIDGSTFLARKSSAASIPQLQGKKIAVAEGTTTMGAVQNALKRGFINAEVVKTRTVAEGFDLLKEGKVDALASDRTVLVGTFLRGGGAEGLTVFAEDLSLEPYGLVLRRGDADFRLAVDRVLAKIYESGEIEGIYGDWLQPLGKATLPLITMYLLNALPD